MSAFVPSTASLSSISSIALSTISFVSCISTTEGSISSCISTIGSVIDGGFSVEKYGSLKWPGCQDGIEDADVDMEVAGDEGKSMGGAWRGLDYFIIFWIPMNI
uniref:Uncharacterized protein n=1 Tax=Ananas comosus var. bracteatus TaxID=296719 RepID=A0A6V7Q0P0_ANACO|nr:unnamed protein product [Ananas comosus var. bracteatus]